MSMADVEEIRDGTDLVIVVHSRESRGHDFKLRRTKVGDAIHVTFGPSSTWHNANELRRMRDALNKVLGEESRTEKDSDSPSLAAKDDGSVEVGGVRFEF